MPFAGMQHDIFIQTKVKNVKVVYSC